MSRTPDIALCIGHSRRNDSGAVSTGGVSEWSYNSQLAPMIDCVLHAYGWNAIVIDRYDASGYSAAMSWLAAELRERNVRAALELHFNSSDNSAARGHEWLCWHTSSGGFALAEALNQSFRGSVSGLPARGVKKRSSGNGSAFLRGTHCPAVIGEPFFGSNANDWGIAQDMNKMAQAYALGIHSYLSSMSVEPGQRQAACG